MFTSAGHAITRSDEDDQFAVRFHVHPAIRVLRTDSPQSVTLTLPDGDTWTFASLQDDVVLEESVYLGSPEGPRRAIQIAIYGGAREVPRVLWSLTRGAPVGSEQAPETGRELPL